MSNVDLNILMSIDDHPNRVKLAGSQRQTHNKVHANVIPLPIWNTQRM
jgi:hypothetical protein